MLNVLICSYLEAEQVERIRQAVPQVHVHYRADLIPKPRYEADHHGLLFKRSSEQEMAWKALMEEADILFDFDRNDIPGMLEDAKKVRWIQATSAGIGQFVKSQRLYTLPIVMTTAAGVHARPLAEFVFWGILTFIKNYPKARSQHAQRHWERFHNDDLEGKTLAIVGLGSVGREVARTAKHFGMRVVATKRDGSGNPETLGVHELYLSSDLHKMLAKADIVVLILPHTAETENMIDARAFAAMKPGTLLVNIGRGASVDEKALVQSLDSGKLMGAVLDVAVEEPLPPSHPLWGFENVFIFPHSASTSKNENRRLVDLFLDNLERYLNQRPLKNVFDLERLY